MSGMSGGPDARVRVAYQGEPGAFGEEAVTARWGDDGEPLPVPTFAAVLAAVREGRASFGLLPVENSIAGAVTAAMAALAADADGLPGDGSVPAVRVVGEVRLAIRPCLLGLPGSTMDTIERVESHPVALAQCGAFLRRHPRLRVQAVNDTAGAARAVAEAGDARRAAIAGRLAARRYGLLVLVADVHDRADNETRFLVLAPVTAAHAEATS